MLVNQRTAGLNFAALVKSRLSTLGREQKELARAAQVTDSYVSQLLRRKKAPPAPDRTDLYARMEAFLALPRGELGRLAQIERAEERRSRPAPVARPLFQEFRELLLRKCVARKRDEVRADFEAQPFGTLERLVAGKLLDVVQRIARRELDSDNWIRLAANFGGRSHEEMRVIVLEFLDTDVFHVSRENCAAFLDPLVDSWDVDLTDLRLDIRLNPALTGDPLRTFRLVEGAPSDGAGIEPGFAEFLDDARLADRITVPETEFLGRQRFNGRRPTKLYYYRALQALRDPLHFDPELR